MQAGALNRRVTLLRAAAEDDGLSSRPGAYAAVGTFWAGRTDVSDGEKIRAGQTLGEMISRFTLRASIQSRGITTADRLRCDGREFDILGIKETEGRAGLEITARARQ